MNSSKPKYMMATKATHLLGDISRNEPDLCIIHSETNDCYIGNWVTGFGLINVEFPKDTTRELTAEEVDYYDGRAVQINSQPPFPLKVREQS